MALPELTLPDGLDPFLADGHAIELTPLYADIPMRTGHDRRRRVYTVAPRTVNVGLLLNQAQVAAVHAWYEGPLQAAACWFSALVERQGAGQLWWKARFVEPYAIEALENHYYRLTARLLLVGDGTTTSPYVAAMQASARLAFGGTAALTTPTNLGAAISLALLPDNPLRAALVLEFLPGGFGGYELREDGGYELREDVSRELRE